MAKRKIYWLTHEVEGSHQARANQLAVKNYDVSFFNSFEDLRREITVTRASIIFFSDSGPLSECKQNLLKLVGMPEARGARLFLSIEKGYEEIKSLASSNNFRDLLPIDLDQSYWIQRFEYSQAAKPIDIKPPAGQVTMNNISAIHLPARIVAIGHEDIRIESSVAVPQGTELSISGPLAQRLGSRFINVRIDKVENSYLRYRFSDALVGTWKPSESARNGAKILIDALRTRSVPDGVRVFISARSRVIRDALFKQLRAPQFELNAALKIQSMILEPRFFSPDVVFIEDALCTGKFAESFPKMLENIDARVPIFLIGGDQELGNIQRKFADRNIQIISRIPDNLPGSPLGDLLKPVAREKKDGSFAIGAEHDISHAEIVIPARLAKVHPSVIQIDAPYRIRRFSLCKISSPIFGKMIGRDLWVKATEIYHNAAGSDDKFETSIDGFIADATRQDRGQIASSIVKLMAGHLAKLAKEEADNKPMAAEPQRTPELGSIGPIPLKAGMADEVSIESSVETGAARSSQVASVSVNRERAEPIQLKTKVRKKKDFDLDDFVDWFTPDRIKQVVVVAFVIGILTAIVTMAAHRDEHSIKMSGKWFTDQLLKYAPDKKSDRP